MFRTRVLLTVKLWLCSSQFLIGWLSTTCAQAGSLDFHPVSKHRQSGQRPFIVDGITIVDTDNWKASLRANANGLNCTATAIAPYAILTAAHCLQRGSRITFEFGGHAGSADCTAAPKYLDGSRLDSDYALCKPTAALTNVPFELLAFNPKDITRVKQLTLAGFGCVNFISEKVLGFGIGDADVWKLPGEIPGAPNTVKTKGGASLCLGDSGGGAYIVKPPSGRRFLAAVNARLDFMDGASQIPVSSFSSISTPDFLCFASAWSKKNRAPIADLPKQECPD
ncbi:hypothetical protein V1283_004595 [Bradyrhizobium sp. AZCC 2262]|uniref:trypsin-like serine protease n=1 Tax=Bradyrhizobium sp. AZCC 2262 TaxID=3117022 RepID=UPI002FF17FBA